MRVLTSAAVAGAAASTFLLRRSERRFVERAQRRLDAVERKVVDTAIGPVEYAERGDGEPVLVSHGIFHGADGGLLSVRDLVAARRVIAPSRFGYLGTPMPADATTSRQADAFAALLDRLEIERTDVIAISAGTSAAVRFALDHPDRIRRLIISSGNFPDSPTAQRPPDWARAAYTDGAMWTLRTVARPAFARLMGVPCGFPRTDEEERTVEELLESIFPIAPRREGAIFDAFVSNPEVGTYDWESITAPTLIVHAADDPLASYDAAAATVERIPGARLVTLPSGGHLQLGQIDRVRDEIGTFVSADARAETRSIA